MAARTGTRNMLHLMFDPQGMRPFVANRDALSRSLLQRVYRKSVGRTVDAGTQRRLDELLAYPDVPRDWKAHQGVPASSVSPTLPVIPIGFVCADIVLRCFSMVTTVGAPQNVAIQELRLECMFPVDDETGARHQQWLAAHANPP